MSGDLFVNLNLNVVCVDTLNFVSAQTLRKISNTGCFCVVIDVDASNINIVRQVQSNLNKLCKLAIGEPLGFALIAGTGPSIIASRFLVEQKGFAYGCSNLGVWVFSSSFLGLPSSLGIFHQWIEEMNLEADDIPRSVWEKFCSESNVRQVRLENELVTAKLNFLKIRLTRSFRLGNVLARAFRKKRLADLARLPITLIREFTRFHSTRLTASEVTELAEQYFSKGLSSRLGKLFPGSEVECRETNSRILDYHGELTNLGLSELVLDSRKIRTYKENSVQAWSELILALKANKSVEDLHQALECIGLSNPLSQRDGDLDLLQKWRRTPLLTAARRKAGEPDHDLGFKPSLNRIIYVLHNSLPHSSGGYATRSHECAKALKAEGFDIVCVTRPGFPNDLNRDAVLPESSTHEIIDGIAYHRILKPRRDGMGLLEYVEKSTDELLAFFKAHTPMGILAASNHVNAMPAMFAAHTLGLPFFYEIRGLWEITRSSRQPSFESSEGYQTAVLYESLVAENAEAVFPITSGIKNEMMSRGVDEQKMTVWPNSMRFECKQVRSNSPSMLPRLTDLKVNGSTVIGYVGTFVDYEGLEQLIEVFCDLRANGLDVKLLMVGSDSASANCDGPISTHLKQILHRRTETDAATFLGRVSPQLLSEVYECLDVFVIPRLPMKVCELVSPMKPLEAMANRVPVVVSSVAAMAEIVQHGETGLVFDKYDKNDLAANLSLLINDPIMRRRLADSAFEWAMHHRTWSITVKPVAKVIKNICRDNVFEFH